MTIAPLPLRSACLAAVAVMLLALPALAADPHPCLLITASQVTAIKQRLPNDTEAMATLDAIQKRIDASLGKTIELPPRGDNWHHWYVCPEHGNRLKTGRKIGPWQWEHICPVGGETLKGDPSKPQTDFDGCCLAAVHTGLVSEARDAGLLFQITGDARYAKHAAGILLAYAAKYESYPLHNIRNELNKIGGGRVGCQTLDESVWLIPTAQAADLIWTTLFEADRKTLANHLFLPAARDVILPHKMGIHNIQCWKNSGVGLAGILLGDDKLIEAAIDDPARGLRAQLAKGIIDDGAWEEGAWGYHFYTMNAIYPLALAIRNTQRDVDIDRYHKMFLAPILMADPRGTLPPFSDSTEASPNGSANLYRGAYEFFKDPALLPLAARGTGGLNSLLYGPVPAPAVANPAPRSANFTSAGQAILCRGTSPDATWIALRYGPHGGGHGHPDKLGFHLVARGENLVIDPGITSYGSKLHYGWYRTSIAHNTLVVDEKDQKPATGKCLAFGSAGGVDYAMMEAGPIADGVRAIRSAVLIDENLLVIVDQVTADKPHMLDIAWHERGTWLTRPAGTPWTSPKKPGYDQLADATVSPLSGPVPMTISVNKSFIPRLTILADRPAELITATGVGGSTKDRVPTAIVRKQDRELAVVWCLALDGADVKVGLAKHSATRCETTITRGSRTWKLTADPASEKAPFVVQ
ncbi:MAG: heparinase II/III family protein [Tepidisphaerales bacterium]